MSWPQTVFFVIFSPCLIFSTFGAEIPQKWQEICGFTELVVQGDEGKFSNIHFRLRGLGMAFRHGVRSGLMQVALEEGCAPFHPEDQERFEEYGKLVESGPFGEFINISASNLGVFHPLPERVLCSGGQLMAEGALQHVQLGKYFHAVYNSSELFTPDTLPSVSLLATNYNRTVQSGIAFISGFLYPMREKLKNINFEIGDSIFLCYKKSCQCPYLLKMWLSEHHEELDTFEKMASPEIRKIVRDSSKLAAFSRVREPLEVLDVALTRFICRRRDLPCKERDGCLTFDNMDQIYNFTTWRARHWYRQPEYMRWAANRMKTLNFLDQILEEVNRLRGEPAATFVRIISAHDVTLAAILDTLGLTFDDPPRYTSRIVFEIFEKEGSQFYFRLLFNGKDRTGELVFCKELDSGLCRVEKLKEFNSNLREMTKEIRERCFI